MKKFFLLFLTAFLFYSFNTVYAEKIVITGPPTALEKRGDIYYFPTGLSIVVTRANQPEFYYFIIDGTEKVCYADEQPNLTLNPTKITMNIGGMLQLRSCYPVDPNYFVLQ